MGRKAFLAGNVLVDVVKRIDAWPEKGRLAYVFGQERACGGAVCNTGVFLKTLDPSLEVAACGKVGADEYGGWLEKFLSDRGLDVSNVSSEEGTSTSYTDVMSVESTGERTFFHARGANALFSREDALAGLRAAGRCEIFHLGYLLLLDALDAPDAECGTAAARLLRDVKSLGIETSVDMVSEQSERFARVVRPALKYCDRLVINEIEGECAAGVPCRDADGRITAASLRRTAEALFGLGVKKSVTLHCPEMGVTLSADGTFAAAGSLELPAGWIKGAVGAGDAFCAGMLYSFIEGMEPEEALRLASAMAAANLSAPDSVSGALPLAETMDLDKRFARRQA